MFQSLLIFILFLSSLGWSLWVSTEREYLFLFWLPISLSLALLFLLNRRRPWYFVSLGILIAVIGYKAARQDFEVSGALYLAAFLGMSFLMDRIRRQLDNEIGLTLTIREKSFRSLSLIEARFAKEDRKIQDLQAKAENIIHLFELAKDFNTCLSFEPLLVTIRDTVLSSLPCRRLRLLVLPSALTDGKLRGYQIDLKDISPWLKNTEIPEEVLAALVRSGEGQVFNVSQKDLLPHFLSDEFQEVSYPLWTFPLRIESAVIAFLIAEGADEKDFYRYQIIAGQLALQIQKTLLYERVHALSLYDGLTGVYVRRHMEERLDEEIKRSHLHGLKLSVLMLDVDHFKSFNDQFGHLVGDKILKEIADVITEEVRTVDLVGRFGGEEFILIFPETDVQGSLDAAERIRSAVAKKKVKVYDEEIRATVSIGIATFPSCFGEKGAGEFSAAWRTEMIERADRALYRAKEDGRNQVKTFNKI